MNEEELRERIGQIYDELLKCDAFRTVDARVSGDTFMACGRILGLGGLLAAINDPEALARLYTQGGLAFTVHIASDAIILGMGLGMLEGTEDFNRVIEMIRQLFEDGCQSVSDALTSGLFPDIPMAPGSDEIQ